MNYPHVSAILKPFVDYSEIPADRLELARDRGIRLHAAFASYALMVWSPKLPAKDRGYFDSFKRWFDQYVVKVHAVEKQLLDDAFGFIGTPDFIGELSMPAGTFLMTVVDWKTPLTPSRTWKAQANAYLHLAKKAGYPAQLSGILQPDPDGNIARMTWVKNEAKHFAAFVSALNCHRYFQS